MLVTMKDVLSVAYENKFAVGAFNIGNGEFLRAILETAEEKRSPVILAIHPSELDFLTESFVAYCRDAANRSSVPVVIHLDHGASSAQIIRAIQCGFTSVMIDASKYSYEENVRITREAVEIAHAVGIPIEAELGTVGQAQGSMEGGEEEILYTDPEQAREFVDRTGIDSLAVAIGTAHGMYPKSRRPKLELDRLRQISSLVSIPLVLHGGSDNSPEEVAESIQYGISKVNISSEMKKAFFGELRARLVDLPNEFEPTNLFPAPIEAAKAIIAQKIELFGSVGKASLYNK
jgi:fructose-bisphosphate aldolase class II